MTVNGKLTFSMEYITPSPAITVINAFPDLMAVIIPFSSIVAILVSLHT